MISVVIPTHNGRDVLPITLTALSRLNRPHSLIEIIIVNNASTDNTSEIINSFIKEFPLDIKHIETRIPGRAHALNLGISQASGKLVVMTDDDVIPDADWIRAYEHAAADYKDYDIFGGQVRHYWQKTPPHWLERLAAEGRSYGGTPMDLPDGPMNVSLVKGANLAIRAHLLSQFQFDEDLGYKAGSPMVAGEETDLVRRAVDNGAKLRHVPNARVQHIVRPHEVGIRPVIRRYFRIGRGSMRSNAHHRTSHVPTIFGYPRHLYRTGFSDTAKILWYWTLGKKYDAMCLAIDTAVKIGRAHEWREAHRGEN